MSNPAKKHWSLAVLAPCIPLLLAATCMGPSQDRIERSMREFDLAAELHREGNRPAAIDRLQASLELDDENARAHFLMGFIHLERLNYREAEPFLQRAVALMDELEERGSVLAEARNVLGICLIHLERYDEAVAVLHESAVDLLNTAPHLAWGNLGLAHHEAGRYQEALDAFAESIQRQSRFCLGYFRMGETLFAMENIPAAEEALSQAVTVDESCVSFQPAFRLRGEVRARLGLAEEAIEDFERCVELGANSSDGQTCQRFLETAQ